MSITQGLLLNPKIIGEQKLLDLYWTAYNLLLEGKTYMSFNGQGNEFSSKFPIPVETMLAEASYALCQLNPSRYGNLRTNVKPYFI